jgi:hypothetical protein
MSNQTIVLAELHQAPGSAHELGSRTNLTEKEVRNAIDGIRRTNGYGAVANHPDQTFSVGQPGSQPPAARK